MDAGFIGDEKVRQRVENALEHILVLYEESKQTSNPKYKTEKYRTIILYVVSILEAVLFAVYAERENKIKKPEYKWKQKLSNKYICIDDGGNRCDGSTVIALKQSTDKAELEIGFQELTSFLVDEKVLKKETAERMCAISGLRNTFHFRKLGSHNCALTDVEEAFELLEYSLKHSRRFLPATK